MAGDAVAAGDGAFKMWNGTVRGFNAKIVSGVPILTEQQRADA